MPYVERVTKAGNTIEIERYFTSRYKKKGISRGDKVKPTKEEQEKVNTRQAERKLRILINANYGYGDYHLVLDYIRRKGEPDRTPEQMRQDIDVFLRECRKEYRKAGLEFKYIHVMEIGKKGARHHHLVVNKIDTEILQRCWYKAYEGHNRVKVFPLDDSGNYAELASYLIKYTGTHKKGTDGALQGKRWNCKEVMNAMVTGVITIVKELPQKIWNSIVGAVTRVATWGNNMLTKAKEVMNAMVTGIVTIVKEIPQKIYNSISGAISKVATWGTEVKNKAVEGMKNVITGITDVFKDIGSTFAGFGKNMVEGIWNGISGATRWIKDKISDWVGDVTDFLKDLFGIASPSKLMRDEIGVYLAQGIGVGFSNEIGGVKKMIEDSVPQEFDVDAKVNVGNEFKYDNDDKKPKPRGGGSAAGGVVVNQYIYANTTDYAKQQKEAARQFRMIARTV